MGSGAAARGKLQAASQPTSKIINEKNLDFRSIRPLKKIADDGEFHHRQNYSKD